MKTVYLPHNTIELLKETPDKIIIKKDGKQWADTVYWNDKEAVGFGYYENRMFVGYCRKYASVPLGIVRKNHDIDYDDFLEKMDFINQAHDCILPFNVLLKRPNMLWKELIDFKIKSDRENFKFPGRLWLDYNIISFWENPQKSELNKIISDLCAALKEMYNITIDINNLKIDMGLIETGKYSNETNLVSVSEYGGDSNGADITTQHTVSPMNKDMNDSRRKAYLQQKNKKTSSLGNMSQAQYNSLKNFSESKIGFEDDGALGYAHIIDDDTINEGITDKFHNIIDRIKHKFTKAKIKINSIKRSVSNYGQSWYITTKCGKKDWLVRVSDHPVGTNRFINDPTLAYIYVNYPEDKINKMINMAIYNYNLLKQRYDEGKEITDKDFITETTIPNIESPYFTFDGKMYKTTDEGKAKLNSINDAVYNKLKTYFPDANVTKTIDNYDYWNPDIAYITVLKSNYLELTFSTSFRPLYDGDENKIFNYLDSILIPENARGQGNAKKAIDAFAELHNEGVIKYLNLKDWSGGFWKHIMERYPFLREKYTHGFITENMQFEVDASEVKLDSFKQQPELHPKFWPNEMLNSKVRLRCLEIADDFIKTLNIPWVEPEDIVLTGSICGFNWSKFSDVDIHLIYDFDKVGEKTNFVREYFNNKKSLWNDEHENLKIYGFPIELYVENIGDNTASSGIYSLEKNKWIVKPEYNQNNNIKLEKYIIKEKAARLMTKIDDLEEEYESTTDNHQMDILAEKVKKLWDKIKHMRKKALENGDEKNIMSIDNVVFKVMRRTGHLDILYDLKLKTYDKLRSINR